MKKVKMICKIIVALWDGRYQTNENTKVKLNSGDNLISLNMNDFSEQILFFIHLLRGASSL